MFFARISDIRAIGADQHHLAGGPSGHRIDTDTRMVLVHLLRFEVSWSSELQYVSGVEHHGNRFPAPRPGSRADQAVRLEAFLAPQTVSSRHQGTVSSSSVDCTICSFRFSMTTTISPSTRSEKNTQNLQSSSGAHLPMPSISESRCQIQKLTEDSILLEVIPSITFSLMSCHEQLDLAQSGLFLWRG